LLANAIKTIYNKRLEEKYYHHDLYDVFFPFVFGHREALVDGCFASGPELLFSALETLTLAEGINGPECTSCQHLELFPITQLVD
jgi:hypothetical protein